MPLTIEEKRRLLREAVERRMAERARKREERKAKDREKAELKKLERKARQAVRNRDNANAADARYRKRKKLTKEAALKARLKRQRAAEAEARKAARAEKAAAKAEADAKAAAAAAQAAAQAAALAGRVREQVAQVAAAEVVEDVFDGAYPGPAAADPLADTRLMLLKRQLVAVNAREKLLDFTRFTMPDPEDPNDPEKSRYEVARHHEAIAHALERLERGEFQCLILTTPPRHGKSELSTKRFAAWVSGRNPRWNIVVSSYSDTMAEDFGADIRTTLQSAQFKQVFPGYGLAPGGAAKDRIQTSQGGLIVAVGRGGALTGRGADLAIVDDPFKDFEEARSQAIRDQAWNWFTKVLMTRRMGRKLVLIIMTRWHEDDIVGRLTDPDNPHFSTEEAENWKIINLPALAEDDDPLGRKVGEPLWPERFDVKFLRQQQRLDPLGFSALYQQRPTVEDGILFRREHVRYYDPAQLPANLRVYAASDHAVGTDQRNDKTCLLTVGIDQHSNIYLLDCWWRRATTDQVVEAMLELARLRNPVIWWAEKGHISKSIGPFLTKRMMETRHFFSLREVTPAKDKVQRAQAISARMAMGHVWFPRGAPWVDAAVDELMKFGPSSARDDFVDALAYIGLGLKAQINAAAPAERAAEPKYGTLGWVKRAQADYEAQQRAKAHGGF